MRSRSFHLSILIGGTFIFASVQSTFASTTDPTTPPTVTPCRSFTTARISKTPATSLSRSPSSTTKPTTATPRSTATRTKTPNTTSSTTKCPQSPTPSTTPLVTSISVCSSTAPISSPPACRNDGLYTFPPDNSTFANAWTGPDWASFPINFTNSPPLPDPEPVPHSIDHPALVRLVQTAQEQLLTQYDAFGTLACFAKGDTTSCKGPWLYGEDWSNSTTGVQYAIRQNTAADPSYYCGFDQFWLSRRERYFYGFSSENVTDSLQGIAHSASMFAAATCTSNSSCVSVYNSDSAQMYYDFRNYIEETFFNFMGTALQDKTRSFCPRNIWSSASMLAIPTTAFNGGKEYLGMHDAVFIPGVAQSLNGTFEEAKKELNILLGTSIRKAEGVFLNMIFFTYGTPLGSNLHKRSVVGDEEVYPGCKRSVWIIEGKCEGIIPPREFDLAGEILPMKDRDRMEVLARLSGSSDLVQRDTCDSMRASISNSLKNFEAGKALFDAAVIALYSYGTLALALQSAGYATVAAANIELLGGFTLVFLMTVAACEAFDDCSFFPPSLVSATKNVAGKLHANAGLAAFFNLISKEGSAVNQVTKTLTAGAGVGFLGVIAAEGYVDFILGAAIKYYKSALDCCDGDCESAVCQQASLGCLLGTGEFWRGDEVGEKGLNCRAY